ncbi:MAG: hypothetical protein LQ340_007081 [Diploschistes diacapsis]|nr:MAG: hypothetical protein LQ340_007081 [Diploschistes diacapsis]
MRSHQYIIHIILYLSVAAAWPWPPDFHKLGGALVRRQNGADAPSSTSKAPDSSQSKALQSAAVSTTDGSQSAAATTAKASGSGTAGTNSAKPTGSASGSAAKTSPPSKTTGKGSSQTGLPVASTIAPNAPPGGISLISPAAATTTYYKIGSNITLAWNYTSLLAPPSAIDVVVSNSASTYTLTQNASIVATQTFIWDTKQYENQQNRLQNAFYTLAVFDAAAGITAAPEPGRLSPYGINAQMGLYSTQQYTPLASGWICPNCNGAMSIAEAQTLKFVGIMFSITLMTFAWFANGLLPGI